MEEPKEPQLELGSYDAKMIQQTLSCSREFSHALSISSMLLVGCGHLQYEVMRWKPEANTSRVTRSLFDWR